MAACLAAQDISGTIDGVVLDPSGAGVPGAKVMVTNVDRNQVIRTLTTDMGGNYASPLIPVGNYEVKAAAAGFKTATRTGIVLNVNDDLKINNTLEVGAVTEAVEVREAAATVELGMATGATTIEGTQIRELSLATRNYEQLVPLMPGVTANTTDELYLGVSAPAGTAATLPYSINGQRNSANNRTVDGADNVDRGGNLTLLNFPSIDAISEFKVERSLYTADAGRAGGGQISVVTKSGASQFHGSAYEFNRNDAYAANNWINNANPRERGERQGPGFDAALERFRVHHRRAGHPRKALQQGPQPDVFLLLGRVSPDHHLHHFPADRAYHGPAAGHIPRAGMRQLHHLLPADLHANRAQPDQPHFGRVHQGHLQQNSAAHKQHHRRLLPPAQRL